MLKQIAIATLVAGISSATLAGSWTVKVGGSYLDVTGHNDLANGAAKDAEGSSKGAFTPSIEYHFGDTPFSAEILLANPISHDVRTANLGTIASLKELPPTITAKYNFPTYSGFTPYVGAGVTVFVPWDVKGEGVFATSDVDADVGVGPAAQIGFNFKPADAKNWGIYGDVRYAELDTKIKVNGADVGKLDLNPIVYTLGYSFNF